MVMAQAVWFLTAAWEAFGPQPCLPQSAPLRPLRGLFLAWSLQKLPGLPCRAVSLLFRWAVRSLVVTPTEVAPKKDGAPWASMASPKFPGLCERPRAETLTLSSKVRALKSVQKTPWQPALVKLDKPNPSGSSPERAACHSGLSLATSPAHRQWSGDSGTRSCTPLCRSMFVLVDEAGSAMGVYGPSTWIP